MNIGYNLHIVFTIQSAIHSPIIDDLRIDSHRVCSSMLTASHYHRYDHVHWESMEINFILIFCVHIHIRMRVRIRARGVIRMKEGIRSEAIAMIFTR